MTLRDEVVRSTALFSFLSLLSDRQALKICRKILEKLKKYPERDCEVQFVRLTYKAWRKNIRQQDIRTNHKAWKLPAEVDLAAWTEFRQKSGDEEFLTVLWAKIVGISEEAIAAGLGVSTGTVSYRLGRGVRLLGEFCREGNDVGR